MKENYHKDVAKYRMDRALENLASARRNFHIGDYKLSVSQSYYSILNAMRALLALKHVESHRHSGVITLFHKHYISTNLFPKEFNKVIRNMKLIREEADYGDFVEITKKMAEDEIAKAERFFRAAEVVFTELLSEDRK